MSSYCHNFFIVSLDRGCLCVLLAGAIFFATEKAREEYADLSPQFPGENHTGEEAHPWELVSPAD